MEEPDPRLPEFEKAKLRASRETSVIAFRKAKEVGIKIVTGTDGYHDNHAMVWALEALVKCGSTPKEALTTATRTPSDVFGLERGVIEPGRYADLIIVNEDPLKNISALRSLRLVMKEGRIFPCV